MKGTFFLIAACYAFELHFDTTGWILGTMVVLNFTANASEAYLKKKGLL